VAVIYKINLLCVVSDIGRDKFWRAEAVSETPPTSWPSRISVPGNTPLAALEGLEKELNLR
jgi:hypothetical protein